MALDFVKTVFQYHADYFLYEIIMLLIILVAGLGLAFLKKKMYKKFSYAKYTRQDVALFCLSQITGNIMLLCFRQEIQFFIISILLILISLLILRNLSFSVFYMIIGVISVSIVLCCLGLLGFDMSVIYYIIRICSVFVTIAIGSDMLLFLISKKQRKNPVSLHLFRQSLLIMICFWIFIMPTNLNFVNASGYTYGKAISMLDTKKSEHPESVSVSDTQSDEQNILSLDINQILTEDADYIYDYNIDSLSDYSEMHLNCHEFKTWYLNDKIYENKILNSVIELTKTYQINPSYLFTYILKYNSEKSKEIPATASDRTDFHFVMDFNAWNREELQADAYTSGIYNELMKNFSMLPEENKTFPLSQDAEPFYSYFAYCDEESVYFVTLYLTLDETNQITEADYTMLQFIDFNQETEQLVMQDYATELEAIYDTAFGNQFTKDSGRYDMILTQENDTVYFRRYYGNYTR